MSKRADIYRKQLEVEDPLVIQLGIQAGLDLEYVQILNHIENRTAYKDLPSGLRAQDAARLDPQPWDS